MNIVSCASNCDFHCRFGQVFRFDILMKKCATSTRIILSEIWKWIITKPKLSTFGDDDDSIRLIIQTPVCSHFSNKISSDLQLYSSLFISWVSNLEHFCIVFGAKIVVYFTNEFDKVISPCTCVLNNVIS